jgi:phage terminase large subunit-like protein
MDSSTETPEAPVDRATDYARRVVAGEIVAGPWVRLACKRHLDDLLVGHLRGLTYDLAEVERAVRFFEEVLHLNGGDFEGQPFNLLGWQVFVVSSLFGWLGADGYRRFREGYIETAKGSGKSPLAAGIGLKGLVADGESRAEIYSAATKKDQAMIMFRDAVAMVDQSPRLQQRLRKSGVGEKTWNLAYHKTGSFFRPISSDDGQSGPRPHISLIDELHEHKTNVVIEMLRAGSKSRRQNMTVAITNSGSDKRGPCWERHEYGIRILKAEVNDDSMFVYICALDEADDPFESEECWPKANPSLQEANLPGYKYIREQVAAAKGMPGKEAIVRRLNFCQWTGADSPWISYEVWKEAYKDYDWKTLRGRRAVAGLDLSSTTDLTGLVFLVQPEAKDEPWLLVPFAWLPEMMLEEREKGDRVPYSQWKAAGYLDTTPGRAISKRVILQKLSQMCEFFEVTACAYDRWRIEDLIALANDEGIILPEMVPFGQGFKDMSPAVEAFETMLLNGLIAHNGHKVLTMCIGNAVVETDAAENRKLSKDKATGRIDLAVAGVMASSLVNGLDDDSTPGIVQLEFNQ